MPKLPHQDQRPSWRNYQTDLQKGAAVRRFWRRILFRGTAFTLLTLGAILGLRLLVHSISGVAQTAAAGLSSPEAAPASQITRNDIRQLLDTKAFSNLTEKNLAVPVKGQILQVETTLDEDLQNYLLEKIDRTNSRYVGIVAMDAGTGRLLAMAGFDKTGSAGNPCLRSDFPAASIFKIVTAASAVDQCGYTADSPIRFNGYKHTLYKRQLTNAVDRYTTTVSLQKAFAESVNPVFGKIGKLQLGRPLLEKSADAFGFNDPLDFELSLSPSHFRITDEPYQWAEAASGFNRDTTISPLHGAAMASAVLNHGRMLAPSIVSNIVDPTGKTLYRWQPGPAQQAMSARAAAALTQMMETTITSGTARKSFRNFRRDRVLSRLQIGGKTGSIGSEAQDLRFDWFVGFARERHGERQLVVSVLVAHEKYIGIRASQYARMAMTRYFGSHAAKGAVASAF